MSNQVGDCFEYLWPFQNVRTLWKKINYILQQLTTIHVGKNLNVFGISSVNFETWQFLVNPIPTGRERCRLCPPHYYLPPPDFWTVQRLCKWIFSIAQNWENKSIIGKRIFMNRYDFFFFSFVVEKTYLWRNHNKYYALLD